MQLIPAKCPDCGGDIKIPEGSTSEVCEYCGGNIIVTDVLGTTAVMQNCMMLAFSAMENKNYKDAYDHFNRAIEIDLNNPNAWFGKAVCTGMTRKLNENSFGQMLELFESSFKYTPAEKQPAMKINASSEIVKIVRKNQKLIQLASEILTLDSDSQFSASIKKDINNLQDKVKNTVLKALEYDPANNAAAALLEEINTGKFFALEQNNQNELTGDYKADETNKPPSVIKNPSETTQPLKTANTKKGGCSFVLFIIFAVIASTGILMKFIHP